MQIRNFPMVRCVRPHLYAGERIDYSIKSAKKPAVSLNCDFIKPGLHGGASVDFFAIGKQTGVKVATVSDGAAVSRLSIENAQKAAPASTLHDSNRWAVTSHHTS